MKKLIVIALLSSVSTNTFAEFALDVGHNQVLQELNAITVNDLGVGESGYVSYFGGLCKFPAGTIGFNKYQELETERNKYSTYLKVKRMPLGKVKIEVSIQKQVSLAGFKLPLSEGKGETLASIAKSMAKIQECVDESFIVESIEGAHSLSGLLELIKNDISNTGSSDSEEISTIEESLDPEPDPVRTWSVTEEKSIIDDSPSVTMILDANEEVSGLYGSSSRPYLVIRCKENKTDAYIGTGSRLENESVTIRLDNGKAYLLEMSESTGGKALFFRSTISNIKKLFTYEKMIFRFTPSNSGAKTVTFNIDGLDAEIEPLRKACHW